MVSPALPQPLPAAYAAPDRLVRLRAICAASMGAFALLALSLAPGASFQVATPGILRSVYTGLVACPSFHVIFSSFLLWAMRDERWLLPVAVPLNLLVMLSAIPCGWHYLTDLVVGALFVVASVAAVRRLAPAP